jgi:hypothetical protein
MWVTTISVLATIEALIPFPLIYVVVILYSLGINSLLVNPITL